MIGKISREKKNKIYCKTSRIKAGTTNNLPVG
jgi:hypothetical protein